MFISSREPSRLFITGGSTAGHTLPNVPIISLLKKVGWDNLLPRVAERDGAGNHVECWNTILPDLARKFRRYWSVRNLAHAFGVLLGVVQAVILFLQLRPHVVFSKGGYVTVPVVLAAWLCRVPVIVHESDMIGPS